MKKLFYLFIVATMFFCSVGETRALNLKLGAKFPIEKLYAEKTTADNTIVVFMPTVTYECDYASMLTQSFYYYFDQKMAFEGLKKSPSTRIFLVVGGKPDAAKSTQNIFGRMRLVFDEEGKLFDYFGVKKPVDKNADSTVVLLDHSDNVAHIDENYRAQGERLKPLENKLKELNGISTKVVQPVKKALKVGDVAPDFRVSETETLSSLRGKVVLISFYPAAFSGALPKPVGATETIQLFGNPLTDDKYSISCVMQIEGLAIPTDEAEARRIVVSSSTRSLLQKWREVLETENVEYTNDADYSISTKYLSYNPKGYNNRVSVIVDQKGRIAFVDTNFDFNDEAILNAKIEELTNKDKK